MAAHVVLADKRFKLCMYSFIWNTHRKPKLDIVIFIRIVDAFTPICPIPIADPELKFHCHISDGSVFVIVAINEV